MKRFGPSTDTAADSGARRGIALLVTICVCLAGCTSEKPPRANVVASPSSAIELNEDLRIGEGEAVDEPVFRGIRHVAVDDDGSMYIVDTQPGTIVHVNSDGVVIRQIGSRGNGPGELGFVYSVSIAGDSISVLRSQGLVAVFDRGSGEYRNQYAFPETPPHKVNTIVINSGKHQVVRLQDAGPITPDGPGDGRVMLMELGGTYYRELFVLPDRQVFTYSRPDGRISMSGYAYSRAPHCASTGGRAYCGWSDSLRFHVWNADGTPAGVLRADFEPLEVSAADRATHEAKYAGTQSEGRARFNETWPAYEAVAGSDDGRLWVKVREARDDDHTALWVIDPESMTSKRGVIDGNVTPMSISDGRLYGIRVDVDGLETLVRYRIVE